MPVDPEQLAQGIGVAAVGFFLRLLLRLHQHDLAAVVLGEQFQQPVVESADLDGRHKPSRRHTPFFQFLQHIIPVIALDFEHAVF